VRVGAACGAPLAAAAREGLDHYAKCIGLAFQVVDDVLDADASTATLGKTAGKDAAQGKATYVSVLGAAAARDFAEALRVEAKRALSAIAADSATPATSDYGVRTSRLAALADFIVLRKF